MTDITHYEANSATPANAADAATALQSRFNKRRLNPVEASARRWCGRRRQPRSCFPCFGSALCTAGSSRPTMTCPTANGW